MTRISPRIGRLDSCRLPAPDSRLRFIDRDFRTWWRAIDNDIPFSRFVAAQLAEDEVPGADEQGVIATGFICPGTWNDEPNDFREYQHDRPEDIAGAAITARRHATGWLSEPGQSKAFVAIPEEVK